MSTDPISKPILEPRHVIAGIAMLSPAEDKELEALLTPDPGAVEYCRITSRFLMARYSVDQLEQIWQQMKKVPGLMS